MTARFVDLVFPRPNWGPSLEATLEQARTRDLADIEATKWDRQLGLALSEAERVTALEVDRRKSAEAKAATYLALVSALLTITLSFQNAILGGKAGPAPAWLSLSFAILAVVYLASSATFLFIAIKTDTTFQVNVPELVKFWGARRDPREDLIKEKLLASRYEQDMVNKKITYINVAQRHIYNAAMVVVALILINAAWYVSVTILSGSASGVQQSSLAPRVSNTPGSGAPAANESGKAEARTKSRPEQPRRTLACGGSRGPCPPPGR